MIQDIERNFDNVILNRKIPAMMTSSPSYLLRPMVQDDLDQVMRIQEQAYIPELHESATAFTGKIQCFPDSNWVIQGQQGLLAYLFSQPAQHLFPPPLNDAGSSIESATALHLHDMAVLPEARGLGIATALVTASLDWGRRQDLAWASLVAVQDSQVFWQARGFSICTPKKSLESYGSGACYMHQSLLG